jgi:hypothetical protein
MTIQTENDRQSVGPVLQAGPVADAIVLAIRQQNHDVRVVDRGAYLRVLCHDRCAVSRAAIEATLRRRFILPGDLELVMSSFKGHFHVDEDEACWELSGGNTDLPPSAPSKGAR